MKKTANLLSEFITKKYILVILIVFLLSVFSSIGFSYFKFNSDTRVFFSEDDKDLITQNELDKQYTKQRNAFLCLEAKEGTVFTQQKLNAIKELTDSVQFLDYAYRASSITNHLYSVSRGDSMLTVELVNDIDVLDTKHRIDSVKNIAINEDGLLGLYLTEDLKVTGINIFYLQPEAYDSQIIIGEDVDLDAISELDDLISFDEGAEVLSDELPNQDKTDDESSSVINVLPEEEGSNQKLASELNSLIERWEKRHPYFNTYKVGQLYTTIAFFDAAINDFKILFPLMGLVILLLMVITTRSVNGTISVVIVLLFSIINAIGISSFLGIEFTSISAQAPVMILTLTVADSIHFLSTTLSKIKLGDTKVAAVKEGIRVNFMPITITSLTTIMGFLTLNFSESPPYRGLGNVAALGIFFAYIFSITLLPALIMLLPFKKYKKVGENSEKNIFVTISDGLAGFVIKNSKPIAVIFTVFFLIMSFFAVKNYSSEEFGEYFSEKTKFRKDLDFFSDKLGGGYVLELSIPSGEVNGINNPEYLKEVEKTTDFLKSRSYVNYVMSFPPIVKKVNMSINGGDEAFSVIPETKQEVAQNLLMFESSLPPNRGLGPLVTTDRSHSRIIAITDRIKSNQMVIYAGEVNDWIKNNLDKSMQVKSTSEPYLFALLGIKQIKNMVKGGIYALIIITITLIIALKSIRYGLLSLIPNIVPILIAFGIWYFLKGTLNSGLAIVFSMTIGIVVDDTVHFLSKYLIARREHNLGVEESIKYSFRTVGRAIIITTIILACGFGVLSQSLFDLNAGMAKLTMLTIILALITDLLYLPALIVLFDKEKK